MMPRPHPETNENSATKARRHKGFIYKKSFCVTLCPGVLVAIFLEDITYIHEKTYKIVTKPLKNQANG